MSRVRLVMFAVCAALCSNAFSATIAVTDPTDNDFWGRNNSVQFNMSGMTVKAEVTVKATSVNDPNVFVTQKKEFTPDGNGKASGTINMNFSETQLNGPYTIQVTATSTVDTYNTPSPIPITLDVKDPKFDSFNPISGVFVRDLVKVTANLIEENIKEWKVTINGNDIPSNTGVNTAVSVDWDTSTIINDGQQSIAIRVEDLAGNTANQSMNVTLDRLPPTANILSPVGGQVYRPGSGIPIVVQITDQFGGAVDERTVDVVVETPTGDFLTRGSMINTTTSGNTMTWTGRIRDTSSIPTKFVIRVKSRDKAGNVGNDQVVSVDTSGRGRGLLQTLGMDGDSSGSVKDAASMLLTRGGMSAYTRGLFSRTRPMSFGRGYNTTRGGN